MSDTPAHAADGEGAAASSTAGAASSAPWGESWSPAVQPPSWLRGLGARAWLLVGVSLLLAAAIALASVARVIVLPLITAAVVAAVMAPLVRRISRGRVPRAAAAALLLLAVAVLMGLVVLAVVGGILSQSGNLSAHLSQATATIQGWLQDLGVSPDKAESTKSGASTGATQAVSTMLHGVIAAIGGLSSVVFFLSMTVLSLFFLLADGPTIRAWVEGHMGLPRPVASTIGRRTLEALRGYFLGVTIVAAFNGILVGLGALVLGVPLPGTIALVTFFAAYIPYLGAWTAGAFAVLVALGGAGTDAAIGMAIIQLLANGILQQLLQPVAYGATLGIHPLAVLVVTIGGGALFGAVGLILGAPLAAAATRISADHAQARRQPEVAAPA